MIKKVNDFLAGLPMTIAAGLFLIASFTLPRAGIVLAVDPAWAAVIISGLPLVYLSVWRIIYNEGISKISSALLITIAMIAAIIIGDLFAASEVAFIMSLGALLEDMTTDRARKGIKDLLSLAPQQGRRLFDGREEMIPIEEIRVGDILRVLPGETIPADGVIVSGDTSVDQSIMTGESLPVDKGPGSSVYCGTINHFGSIDMKAVSVGQDSSLQKLISMVRDAENKQAPMQRIADRCASWLVPVALLIAITALIFTRDIVRAVTVLVVFCPCALVLATPTAIMAAIGQATKHGVIIKSGEALEKMGKIKTIAFDKTGTLTCGTLAVTDILSLQDGTGEDDLLRLAAAAESRSEHPLAKAITSHGMCQLGELPSCEGFRMDAGKGIFARVSDKKLFCGSERYLKENGVSFSEAASEALEKLRSEGKASVLIADENNCLGVIGLSDVLRPEAAAMIQSLKRLGTETVLLTGDHQQAADFFAARCGIDRVCAELLPEQKVSRIADLQADGALICMVGDGVNDAPALKTAAVGAAMGSIGSDIAVDAADIALMSDDLSRIPYLKRLANATVHTIKFGITLSMVINFIAICLSVAGILTPTTGALVHNAGSCLVVLIAALLYDRKFE